MLPPGKWGDHPTYQAVTQDFRGVVTPTAPGVAFRAAQHRDAMSYRSRRKPFLLAEGRDVQLDSGQVGQITLMGVPACFYSLKRDVQLDFSAKEGTTVVVGTLFLFTEARDVQLDTQHIWLRPRALFLFA